MRSLWSLLATGVVPTCSSHSLSCLYHKPLPLPSAHAAATPASFAGRYGGAGAGRSQLTGTFKLCKPSCHSTDGRQPRSQHQLGGSSGHTRSSSRPSCQALQMRPRGLQLRYLTRLWSLAALQVLHLSVFIA
ncbi:hypothetical protein V8C86DRAFT_90035 [Haematococcus lacustris]